MGGGIDEVIEVCDGGELMRATGRYGRGASALVYHVPDAELLRGLEHGYGVVYEETCLGVEAGEFCRAMPVLHVFFWRAELVGGEHGVEVFAYARLLEFEAYGFVMRVGEQVYFLAARAHLHEEFMSVGQGVYEVRKLPLHARDVEPKLLTPEFEVSPFERGLVAFVRGEEMISGLVSARIVYLGPAGWYELQPEGIIEVLVQQCAVQVQ